MAKAPSKAQPEFYSGKTLYPIILVLIALSALFGLVIMPRLSPAGGGLLKEPAPDFALPVVTTGTPEGRIKLSDLRGKLVVLDFWASWCAPCARQAPILDRVARKHDDVVVLGINVDDTPAVAGAYARRKGLSYPILSDTQGEAQRRYGASSLPTLVFIDATGNISAFVPGLASQQQVERILGNMRR